MVSLRRRRLLGLCLGARNSFLSPLPRLYESGSGNARENASHRSNPVSVHPMPMDDTKLPLEASDPSTGIVASNASNSSSSKHQGNQPNISSSVSNSSKEQNTRPTSEQEDMHKKHPWRRHMKNNQDQCVLKGVYFKNMKWQAAIKVGKKQIHLGTVSSRGKAAQLYDRAAFMCGREPNFELPRGRKARTQNFEWDEFLAMTRHAITSKSKTSHF